MEAHDGATAFCVNPVTVVKSSLTSEAMKTLVHAFVSSHLDYCNSLLYGISDSLLTKLQTVQNAAAHVVTGTTSSSAATTPLASGTAANHLQVGDDHLQMPSDRSWSGDILPG